MQYLFHKGREDAAKEAEAAKAKPAQPEADPFDDPKSAAEIRAGANQQWIRQTRPGPDLASIKDETVTARDGKPIPVRIYRPKAKGTMPIRVYYHGGGWLFGNIEADRKSVVEGKGGAGRVDTGGGRSIKKKKK